MAAAVALVGKEQKSLGVAHVGEVLEAGERRPDQDLFALVLGQLGLAPVVGDVFWNFSSSRSDKISASSVPSCLATSAGVMPPASLSGEPHGAGARASRRGNARGRWKAFLSFIGF